MIPRTIFEPEHEQFRDNVRCWAEAELFPHEEKWRHDGMVSRAAWRSAGEQGFLAMYVEEEFGGLGIDDYRFDQILIEELSVRSPGFYIHLHNRVVGPYLTRLGTAEQKTRLCPGIVDGSRILAIGITEPGAGSDVAAIRTSARRDGDEWILNGSKIYISNGILADLIVVAARTDASNPRAIGLFLVEEGAAGFRRGRKLEKLGLKSQDTAELFFDDVRIPAVNVLGDPAGGFKAMMTGLAEERLTGAVSYVARAERAFAITLDFIKERKAFGRPIGQFQNSRFVMADLRTAIDACWTFVDQCTRLHLDNCLTADLAAQAKLLCSETEARVVDSCLQLHGGAGYMDEYEISRLYAERAFRAYMRARQRSCGRSSAEIWVWTTVTAEQNTLVKSRDFEIGLAAFRAQGGPRFERR